MGNYEGLSELARAWLAKLEAAGFVPLRAVRDAGAEAAIAELVEAGFATVTDTQVRLVQTRPAVAGTVGGLNHADAETEADTRRVPRPRTWGGRQLSAQAAHWLRALLAAGAAGLPASEVHEEDGGAALVELMRAGLAERTGDTLDSAEPGDVRYVIRAESSPGSPAALPSLQPSRCGCGSPWGSNAALLAWVYSTGLKPDRLEVTCVKGCRGEVSLEWPEPTIVEEIEVPEAVSLASLAPGIRQVGVAALAAILLLGFALGVTLFGLYQQGERYAAREVRFQEELRALSAERKADRELLEQVDARSREARKQLHEVDTRASLALTRMERTSESVGAWLAQTAELQARLESLVETVGDGRK